LVDAERAGARLARLEKLIENLDAIRIEGEDNYLTEEQLRMRAERQLELAVLVHLCMDIDDRKVFSSLESLDDLREFAKVVAVQIA
jgi:uncharacterized protein YutE (UPF0331/DUF86 family)